jgi:Leucine-rich repeat (LRR) protein
MKIIVKYNSIWFQSYFNFKGNEYTYTSFDSISKYDNIVILECSNNRLTSLPKLPNSVKRLLCSYNQITSLPELYNSVEFITCYYNKLKILPELPNSLNIYCKYNQFIKTIK